MPRKSARPALADESAPAGGAVAVDRALSLLGAFKSGDAALSLTELSTRTRLYKSTALRLLASLLHARLLRQTEDGRYALGPGIARLHALYVSSFSLEPVVMPLLRDLVARTQESAALHVRLGDQRLCLHRVDSPQLLRDHVRAGDLLPLERGAGGRVLLAFSGARGPVYARIRAEGVAVLDGDRVAGLAGVAAPVFAGDGSLVGALTLSLPSTRMRVRLAADVRAAAFDLSRQLGGAA
jgi:DNA-binding IclR family transcriptional regulator